MTHYNTEDNSLAARFAHPPASYRSLPFWSWNVRLQPDEIAAQIRDMAAHGMGGFFMHSREGLETPYMGDEWFDAVDSAVKTAGEQGVKAWIYDEDRWPSGAAGGRVSAGGDAYRMKALVLYEGDVVPEEAFDYAYAARIDGETICELRPLEGKLPSGYRFLGLRRQVYDKCEWFNHETYADNLNPAAVRRFLDMVYEPYAARYGEEFGRAIAGVFTDEPNIHGVRSVFSIPNGYVPWTDRLAAEFYARRGWMLEEALPYLFFEGERAFKTRHDYWRTVGELFCESYIQQMYRWCDSHGLVSTGHFIFENDLGVSTRGSGGLMKQYAWLHMPGIDLLTDQTVEYLTVRQCTSVARQMGRRWVLSEMYGCTGWQADFDMQRRLGDWQFVQGVNLRCQHLALYSLKGCRKRDFPPGFNYNTSWWPYNRIMEDYFARLSVLLTQGEAVRDLLVLHPQATAWGRLGSDRKAPSIRQEGGVKLAVIDSNMQRVDEYGQAFNALLENLSRRQFDFDLGDEELIARQGGANGARFEIGQCAYKTVILPQLDTLLTSTYKELEGFIQAGGRLLGLLPKPSRLDGEAAQLPALDGGLWFDSEQALLDWMDGNIPPAIDARGEDGRKPRDILAMCRQDGERQTVFLVNTSQTLAQRGTVRFDSTGLLTEWDCMTGETNPAACRQEGSGLMWLYEIEPAASVVAVLEPGKAQPQERPVFQTGRVQELPDNWAIAPGAPNLLVLDRCAWRLGNGDWQPQTEVWRAQKAVRETLGMPPNHYNGLPQRYGWANTTHESDGALLTLRFIFHVAQIPPAPLRAVIEEAGIFDLRLNGQPVNASPEGWFLDKSFETVELPLPRAGENTLELSCRYCNRHELEDIFLIGEFGVNTERVITEPVRHLQAGDWTTQGFPHYCGAITYEQTFDLPAHGRVQLRLPPIKAVLAEIAVNGQTAGHVIGKGETRTDITKVCREGHNSLAITVVGSPKNMLGPLHQANPRPSWTDWRNFRTQGADYCGGYTLEPYGLTGCAAVQWEEMRWSGGL